MHCNRQTWLIYYFTKRCKSSRVQRPDLAINPSTYFMGYFLSRICFVVVVIFIRMYPYSSGSGNDSSLQWVLQRRAVFKFLHNFRRMLYFLAKSGAEAMFRKKFNEDWINQSIDQSMAVVCLGNRQVSGTLTKLETLPVLWIVFPSV